MDTSPPDVRTARASASHMSSFHRASRFGLVFVLALATLTMVLLTQRSNPASAAAAPVTQCNGEANVGGQGIRCTVTIVNHVDSNGAATAPSAITVTKCTGAAGPIAAGAGTCNTTITSSPEPITLIQQCNGSGSGGGGVVICSVQVTNSFSSAPVSAIGAATVYQCVGSGDGVSAVCAPANTPGITSVGQATVGQCNGSGNGGTSAGFVCTVGGASTMTLSFPMNIDQCNNSANGGGARVECTAAVTNQVLPPTLTPTATATQTGAATGTATTLTATPSSTSTVTPTGTSAPPTTATPPTTAAPPTSRQTSTTTPTITLTPVPSSTATPAATGTPPATVTRTVTPVIPAPTTPAPGPPATGNSGAPGTGTGSQAALWLLGLAIVGAAIAFIGAQRRPFPRRRS
ncbi:MAG TPA: hypothetical protein PKD75_10910 [Tepidiformaceae bacterium]|nr:hypothetical protein [Tepidiformaceae bacterium]